MYRSLFPTKQKMVVNVEAQIDIWRERWPLLELLPVHLSSAESSHDLFCCFVRYIDIWPSIHNDRSLALLSPNLFINKYCTFFIGIKYHICQPAVAPGIIVVDGMRTSADWCSKYTTIFLIRILLIPKRGEKFYYFHFQIKQIYWGKKTICVIQYFF